MTEGSQEFCLRWNNHQATIISVFDYLLENETLVDCTLAAEGQYLKAHKVVLCACSPYLELLLSQHNDKHPILIFKDIKFNELKSMIDYMYKGEVNIAQDQLNHFLKAAESLQIKGLSESEEESTTQTAAPTPRPPPPRAPPVQRTQPRPISNAVAVRSSDVVDLPESPKRINRNDAASPSRKRRRQVVPVQGRPSLSGDDASNASEGHLDQSNCDVPSNTSLQSSENAVAKVETNSELMLEPKTEYDDNSVEDITLDDDEEDYSQAGTSQMDNSQMNFSGWQQMVGDKSTDDVFAGQDTGAQNSQEITELREFEVPREVPKSKSPLLGSKKIDQPEDSNQVTSTLTQVDLKSKKRSKKLKLIERKTSVIFNRSCTSATTNPVTKVANEENDLKTNVLYQPSNELHDIHNIDHVEVINESTSDNFTEINQLLQIDQSQLLELHPFIELADINTTSLPEITHNTPSFNQITAPADFKTSETLLNNDQNVPETNGDVDKNKLFGHLSLENNMPMSSPKPTELPNTLSVQSSHEKITKINENDLPHNAFNAYIETNCQDENEKMFLRNFVWNSQKINTSLQLGEYDSKHTNLEAINTLANEDLNNFKEIECLNESLKSNCVQNTSKLIDLNSPVVLSENLSASFNTHGNIPYEHKEFHVIDIEQELKQSSGIRLPNSPVIHLDSSLSHTNGLSPVDSNKLNQLELLVLLNDEELSSNSNESANTNLKAKPNPKSVEPIKGRYFKSKFRLALESKEYLICTFCNEKISVMLDEVAEHCKTCKHIVRRDKSKKFRFGCFTCDYKSNQLSHLKRHLTAHLRYIPK